MEIKIFKGNILDADVDAIVNPADGYGWMNGGVSAAIKERAGPEVEKEAILKGPTPIGWAILTLGGRRQGLRPSSMPLPWIPIAIGRVQRLY